MRQLLIYILSSLIFISGCGNNGKSQPHNVNGETEIVMWLIGSEGQAQTIKEISKEFYKQTKIKVKCDAISWGDAHSKYLTSIAGGVAPDIGTMGLTWGAEFGNLGALMDLRASYPEEVKEITSSMFKGLLDSIQYKGKTFGIPFDMTEYIVYYRNDIIPQPPATWDELTVILSKLNMSGKSMLFEWGSLDWIGYSPFLWQAGGEYYNADHTKVLLGSPEAIKAMEFFSNLYTKYNVPKTKIPLEQGMRTGDFPIAISGNWKIDSLRLGAPEIDGKWSIAMMPAGPSGKRTAFIGGRIMGIFSQSVHKEEAWKFIKFLSSPEAQKKMYDAALTKQDTYLPPSKKSWDLLNMDPKFKEVLVAQANDAKGPPPVADWDASTEYVDDAIQSIILQQSDVKVELDKTAAILQGAIDRKS